MPAPERLRKQQFALASHIRNSDNPPPPNIEERRLAIYRQLFYNNLQSLLAANFPVIRRTLSDEQWHALIANFLRDYRCQTPLFPELPREFIRFLEQRGEHTNPQNDPPWLTELAHYEWVELALDLAETDDHENSILPISNENLLDSRFTLSPVAWALAYRWPVHRISPDYQPVEPPAEATFLLVQRDTGLKVRFREISALTWRLLDRIADTADDSGREHLQALADEAGISDSQDFVAQGGLMLQQLRATGVLLVSNSN